MTTPDPGPIPALPIEYASAPLDHTHAKWRTWGIVFGVIPIVIGSLSGLLGLVMPLALLVPARTGMPAQRPAALFGGMALYLVVGGLLIWLGIGAVTMCRRVRPLSLTLGTIALVGGILGIFSFALFFPAMRSAMIAPTIVNGRPVAMPAGFYVIMMSAMLVVMGVLFVIIPGAFVWFYRKDEVRAALEFYDPKPRWTDACPIPVLGLAVGLVLYALSALLTTAQAIAPVFGTVLHGAPAVAVMLVFACVAVALARQVYQIRISGWWGTIIFIIVLMAAYLMTAIRSSRRSYIPITRVTPRSSFGGFGFFGQMGIGFRLAIGLPWLILIFGYLLYVRRYFKAAANEQQPINFPTTG